ncbi:glycosyltransferase family 87 protein [Thermoplasma volcanium]|nr:glycosyltransferase family 87 protein [Thermoplasma volcanium]
MNRFRSWDVALSITLIIYASVAWLSVGYDDLAALILVWIELFTAAFLLIQSVTSISVRTRGALIYFSILTSLLLLVTISVKYVSSSQLEDEILIQTNAAYLFLHGQDPYVKANMLKLFSVSTVPIFNTPALTGGYVYYLIYPGLSVLLFLPSVYFHFYPAYVIITFNFLSIILLIEYYRRQKMQLQVPLIITIVMVSAFYLGFTVAGVSSIIWVFFLAAAYVSRKNPYISGALFGLSAAYKQDPIIVLPFFIYFLYKEYGTLHAGKFVGLASASFLLVNLPFIIMGPYAWFTSVLGVATQKVIGVGFGPSILSFAGYINISPLYFIALLIAAELVLFYFYAKYYNALKWSFFAFPALVMLLNYRVLISYLIYWPFLIMLVLPDVNILENTIKPLRIKRKVFIAISIIIVLITAGFMVPVQANHSTMKINGIPEYGDNLSVPGYLDYMLVSINYEPGNGDNSTTPVYFRIFPDVGMQNYNINGLLWHTPVKLRPGHNIVPIYPDNYYDLLPSNVSFNIEAYYGKVSTFFHSSGIYASPKYPIDNPMLLYPSYDKASPFPGWTLYGKNYSFNYTSSGFLIRSEGWVYIESPVDILNPNISNFTLSYRISGYGVYGYSIDFSGFNYTVSSTKFEYNSNTTFFTISNNISLVNFTEARDVAYEYKWPMYSTTFVFFCGPNSYISVGDGNATYR